MIIRIKDAKVHASTGYMEVDVVSVKKTGNSEVEGPIKTYGIDAHIFQSKYNGDMQLWLNAIKGTHEVHSGHHDELANQLMGLKGKEL